MLAYIQELYFSICNIFNNENMAIEETNLLDMTPQPAQVALHLLQSPISMDHFLLQLLNLALKILYLGCSSVFEFWDK